MSKENERQLADAMRLIEELRAAFVVLSGRLFVCEAQFAMLSNLLFPLQMRKGKELN